MDLSAAFDIVNHEILLAKMKYYGIEDTELELFSSYLEDRQQFVEIDTMKSMVRTAPAVSVVQGGKLSGTLYVKEIT